MLRASRRAVLSRHIFVDAETLSELKQMAVESGSPYQPLLNRILKDAVDKRKSDGSRLDRLEREIEKIKRKISA